MTRLVYTIEVIRLSKPLSTKQWLATLQIPEANVNIQIAADYGWEALRLLAIKARAKGLLE